MDWIIGTGYYLMDWIGVLTVMIWDGWLDTWMKGICTWNHGCSFSSHKGYLKHGTQRRHLSYPVRLNYVYESGIFLFTYLLINSLPFLILHIWHWKVRSMKMRRTTSGRLERSKTKQEEEMRRECIQSVVGSRCKKTWNNQWILLPTSFVWVGG